MRSILVRRVPYSLGGLLFLTASLAGCGGAAKQGDLDAAAPSDASADAPASDATVESGADSATSGVDAGDATSAANDSGGSAGEAGDGDAALDAGAPDGDAGGDAEADAAKLACTDSTYSDPWSPGYIEDAGVHASAQATVSAMTLSQKANQMRGEPNGLPNGANFSNIFATPDDVADGVKGFLFRGGSHGVVLAAQLPAGQLGYSTAFPVAAARGAAFDMDLEYQIGVATGDETLASGNTMILAPSLDLVRHPAWGRAQEAYGEDAFLVGRLGTAFTSGAQTYIPACATHFAVYNIEDGRASTNMSLDEQTLREFYARPFGAVIADAGLGCVMAAYNLVNGIDSTLSTHLLTDILRTDMGFKGFVVSDWWALPPGTASATTQALQNTAVAGVNAQMDLEMPWSYDYAQIEAVTGTGEPLSATQISTSATRIVEQKSRFHVDRLGGPLGLKPPTTVFDGSGSIANNEADIALSLRAAKESMVLLKNENNTLPIQRTKVKTIAVLGASVPFSTPGTTPASGTINFATDVRLGDLGSSRVLSDPAQSVGPFAGIQAAAGSAITVVTGADTSVAANADFIVVVAGLTPQDEGEEYTGAGDRTSFDLDAKTCPNCGTSGPQATLIAQAAALGKPMVVVLEGGSIINMPWLGQVPAVVMAWYPGMTGGTALGALLFGDANFGGKLPVTWPVQWSDEPVFTGPGQTTAVDYYVGYHYFDQNGIAPLLPFGAGLSYTSFQYGNLVVPCATVTDGGVVEVQADVTNTGAVAGDEVTYLFVSYPNTAVRRPAKELKGFVRETVQPGQTVRVTIPLRVSDLKYWDTTSSSWKVESGPVTVMVGGSSVNLPLSDTLVVQ